MDCIIGRLILDCLALVVFWGAIGAAIIEQCPSCVCRLRDNPPTDLCWLIERGQAVNHSPTIWWKGGDVRPMDDWPDCWTQTAHEARRFATKDEAETLAAKLFDLASVSITQHAFLGADKSTDGGER